VAEDSTVRIVAWPDEPARVTVATDPASPVSVDMNTRVTVRDDIGVCLKICEPICAESDYRIGISIFSNPFASISVRGITRLFRCADRGRPSETCVSFEELKGATEYAAPFSHQGIQFSPIGDPLRVATFGDPVGRMKLAFPPSGIRVQFPGPASHSRVTVNNYAGPTLNFAIYSNGNLIDRFSESVNGTVREIGVAHSNVTAIEISGGDNEAALVEVCFAT
jgi:hypothetical protein